MSVLLSMISLVVMGVMVSLLLILARLLPAEMVAWDEVGMLAEACDGSIFRWWWC